MGHHHRQADRRVREMARGNWRRMVRCLRHRLVRALPLVVLAVLPTRCSRGAPSESAEAVRQFGYGPQPDRHVRYQPDVMMIEGGANAVRGVSSDGLTWTIDSRARGAHDLKIGQIMFATSRAVGRVAAIQERERDLAVTLVPVSLTEVIRDA